MKKTNIAKKAFTLFLTFTLTFGLVTGCSENPDLALSDGDAEKTEPDEDIGESDKPTNREEPNNPNEDEEILTDPNRNVGKPTDPDEDEDPDEEEDDENPLYIVGQQMTLDLISEMNDGVMPIIRYNDDGTIRQVTYLPTDFPDNSLSPFPVFTEDDAQALFYQYLTLFSIDENIDFRFYEKNDFRFRLYQYINGLRNEGGLITISYDKETGNVYSIVTGPHIRLNIETTPIISLEEAKQIILSLYDVDFFEPDEYELYIHNNELAWIIYTVPKVDFIRIVHLSAVTGEVFFATHGPTEPLLPIDG